MTPPSQSQARGEVCTRTTDGIPKSQVTNDGKGISRRTMLGGAGLAGLAALGFGTLGACSNTANSGSGEGAAGASSDLMATVYPFRGEHQSGIITPAQQQMHVAVYDLITDSREKVVELLTTWTRAAENMCGGYPVNGPRTSKNAPPDDTGETLDMGAAGLTITFGFGATFFTKDGVDRYGIADRKPTALLDAIPRMSAEKLDPERVGGDLIVQACGEDPMVTMHAIHNLSRLAFGTATVRYTQLGYGRTSSTSTQQATPRNLFGFKDGTNNIKGDEADQDSVNDNLWIHAGDDGGEWFEGGTYMCCRRIDMMMEVWDELILAEQERLVGRDKVEGAPLSGGKEFDPPDFAAVGADGATKIDANSHVALMHPDNNGGARMLRRGYNYMEGSDKLGRLKGGLFFIAFVRNPQTNFIPILAKMRTDLMGEYLQTSGSGLFLIPPGVGEGETFIGEKLFT